MDAPGVDAASRRRITRAFGAAGEAWLETLPALLAAAAQRWHLTLGAPLGPLSYNYVTAATRSDGSRVVLKAGVPGTELHFEIDALRHFDGRGSVRLLDADDAAGVFLIERLEPGTPIVEIDDAAGTRIAAGIMRRLWRPPPQDHGMPTLADWGRAFAELRARHGGGSGPLPPPLFDRAEALYDELVATQQDAVVLHGDLHHWNILGAGREPWLAIDPHGVVGEPAFEVGPWMRNPVGDPGDADEAVFLMNQPDPRRIIERRLDIFAEELALPRDRLRDWSLAFAILSACWSDESGHAAGWQQAVAVAEILTGV